MLAFEIDESSTAIKSAEKLLGPMCGLPRGQRRSAYALKVERVLRQRVLWDLSVAIITIHYLHPSCPVRGFPAGESAGVGCEGVRKAV